MSSFLNDIDLSNSDLCEVEYFEIVLADLHPTYGRLAIADLAIPIFRRRRIMAARFHNPVARPWWKLGCYLKQSIPAPVTIDSSGSIEVTRWRIPLYQRTTNREQLIFFPDSSPRVWRLTASIPRWHLEAHITVWRYIRELPPSFWQTINVVENKVDQILERLSNRNT
ncbi:hypothetical protein [Microseira sp. BLCC-F43]|jgi:hypothetical protein|uniref:hypothetical protein n=1 Tax=Microseira sp. BLCC-F43 TaxID=3153602 RepID=UPI0035BA5925